jgi:hypothetical protein
VQRVHNKALQESVILSLVQFVAIVLFECNEAEDYGPAKTLMNMAFTFYHEGNKLTSFRFAAGESSDLLRGLRKAELMLAALTACTGGN